MLSTTRHRKLLLAVALLAGSAVVAFTALRIRDAVLFSRLSATEKRIVGAWSWTYIEGVGRMIFRADRTVIEGFPPDDPEKPAVHDSDFTFLLAGTWHVEGDILVTDITNQPVLDRWGDMPDKPQFDRKVRREKILSIDDKQIAFEGDHSALQRVHP
jgi:hypothetical protein